MEARKGAGVFALQAKTEPQRPFDDLATQRISSLSNCLNCERSSRSKSAGLAPLAVGRPDRSDSGSPWKGCAMSGRRCADTRCGFQSSLCDCRSNPEQAFSLSSSNLSRQGIIPRGDLQGSPPGSRPKDYNLHLQEEHGLIVEAIIEGDAETARAHMRSHLRGSLDRYKVLLRSQTSATSAARKPDQALSDRNGKIYDVMVHHLIRVFHVANQFSRCLSRSRRDTPSPSRVTRVDGGILSV